MTINVKVKRLKDNAKLPTYGSDGAACFDLYSTEDVTLKQGEPVAIGTGLAFAVPDGYAMLVYSRSGHGFKHGIRLSNTTGVVDSDYRGEVKIRLVMDDAGDPQVFPAGSRLAQARIVEAPHVVFEDVGNLDETHRGEGGFGSTGS